MLFLILAHTAAGANGYVRSDPDPRQHHSIDARCRAGGPGQRDFLAISDNAGDICTRDVGYHRQLEFQQSGANAVVAERLIVGGSQPFRVQQLAA